MNADLVLAAAAELHGQEAAPARAGQATHARDGGLSPAGGADAHAARVVAVATERLLYDLLARGKASLDHGEVALCHGVAGHLRVKRRLRGLV